VIKNKNLLIVYPLLIISMVFWGGSFVWAKQALVYYNPIAIIFFRLLFSAIILILFLFITKKIQIPKKKDLPYFLLLSFFEPFLYFLGETNALTFMDSSTSSILISVIPLFTPFVAFIFLHEKIKVLNIVGILISIFGIGFLVFDSNLTLQVSGKGIALISLAIIAANGYSVMIKKIDNAYSVITVTFWQNLIGMIYFLPLFFIFSYKNVFETEFNQDAFFSILKLGFFASSLAFIFYMYALRNLPVSKTNVFTNFIPVFTIIISYFVLNEGIELKKIIGICIIILGITISQLIMWKENINE
jgi:drug/metabolite transporter (DMT)-like permease